MEDNKELGHSPFRDIPDEWKLVPVKYIAPLRTEKSPITGTSISLEQIQSGTGRLLNTSETVAGDGVLFQNGDILFGKLRPYLAKVYKAESVGHAFGDIIVFAPSAVVSEFLFFVLISHEFIKEVDHSTYGTKMPRANPEFICSIRVPIPSLDEQKSISAFLHYELAKIDALIDEQKRLIELLKEKRQAVISHAVTKGLNPDAPMKDSGVEWLGEVPEHWEVLSIRRLINEHKQGYYTTDSYVDDGVKLLRITDLDGRGSLSTEKCPKVPEGQNLESYTLQHGDVVFARTGGAGLFGVFEENEKVIFASYLIRFKFNQRLVVPKFLRQFLLSGSFQTQLETQVHGGVNKNVHAEDIKNAAMAVPPINEQALIAQEVELQENLFDKLIDTAEQSISLMNERRSALISAAVTGKIDVRDWQPPAGSDTVDSNASMQTERHYG